MSFERFCVWIQFDNPRIVSANSYDNSIQNVRISFCCCWQTFMQLSVCVWLFGMMPYVSVKWDLTNVIENISKQFSWSTKQTDRLQVKRNYLCCAVSQAMKIESLSIMTPKILMQSTGTMKERELQLKKNVESAKGKTRN